MIKCETAPERFWNSESMADEWIGGYKTAIVFVDAIAALIPASDGPDGMKRTEIHLANGRCLLMIGTVDGFATLLENCGAKRLRNREVEEIWKKDSSPANTAAD